MADPRDDDAITQAMRDARAREAVRRERALQPIRPHHHPIGVESGAPAGAEGDRSAAQEPIDLDAIDSFADLAAALARTSGAGRVVGEAADALIAMLDAQDALVVVAFGEDLVAAGHDRLAATMIAEGWADVILLDPSNLAALEDDVAAVAFGWPEGRALSSRALCEALGARLAARAPDHLLARAHARALPVVVPGFAECPASAALREANRLRRREGRAGVAFDPFVDHDLHAERLHAAPAVGLFSVGGGVPRSFALAGAVVPHWEARLTATEAAVGWPLIALAARARLRPVD